MIILGINAYHADSSAAIFVDGKLVAAIEEERFRRVKHWAGFPELAIEFCLQQAGIRYEQVDHYAIGRDPKAKFFKKILYLAKNPGGSFAAVKDRLNNSRKVASIENELSRISGLPAKTFSGKIKNIEHHRSHLASAFFASPFDKAALLSIDGSGDFTTTMIGIGTGNTIEVLDSIDFPHSLGIFYTAFTQLLGFPHYGDEYKVMGMAPYGSRESGVGPALRIRRGGAGGSRGKSRLMRKSVKWCGLRMTGCSRWIFLISERVHRELFLMIKTMHRW